MSRILPNAESEFYHIYNRGTEKRKIFLSKHDYSRFITLLYICNNTSPMHLRDHIFEYKKNFNTPRTETLVDICAYCLMPNHFHILIKTKNESGASLFMQKLQTAYTMYFNKKNERTGALFQGKYKCKIVLDDTYLKHLIAYIHLNPLSLIQNDWKEVGVQNIKKAKSFITNYLFSSYFDFLGNSRIESAILERVLPDYFSTKKDFTDYIEDYFTNRD